jgi:hypothetical protein
MYAVLFAALLCPLANAVLLGETVLRTVLQTALKYNSAHTSLLTPLRLSAHRRVGVRTSLKLALSGTLRS